MRCWVSFSVESARPGHGDWDMPVSAHTSGDSENKLNAMGSLVTRGQANMEAPRSFPQSASATTWALSGRTAKTRRTASARRPQDSAGASPTWWGRPVTAVPPTRGAWPAAPAASSAAVTLRAPWDLPATR